VTMTFTQRDGHSRMSGKGIPTHIETKVSFIRS